MINTREFIGFTGSRKGFSNDALLRRVVDSVEGCQIRVGCARGVDAAIRDIRPDAHVSYVASPGAGSGSRSWGVALARRSMSMVDGCFLVIGFVSDACPLCVSPGRSFVGGGSGTWASLAYAVGKGISIIVFLDDGVSLPEWQGGHWEKAGTDGIFREGMTWISESEYIQGSLLG